MPHYLFSSCTFFPRFSAEFRIRERLSPVISLLFEYLWFILQCHRKSNSTSLEVTCHLDRMSWILKYCYQYAINCCFTLYRQLYFSISGYCSSIGLYYPNVMICCMYHKLFHYVMKKNRSYNIQTTFTLSLRNSYNIILY